jgi:hypothetical protein
MGQLVEVGAALRELQLICQRHGAALVLTHHWNQTGTGSGPMRLSGAGMAEWGRVLVTAEVITRKDSDSASTVVLRISATGDETADVAIEVRRETGIAGDTHDLSAPMTYRVEQISVPAEVGQYSTCADCVRAVLLQRPGETLTCHEIGDITASWGKPFQKRTLLDALSKLVEQEGLKHIENPSRAGDRWGFP